MRRVCVFLLLDGLRVSLARYLADTLSLSLALPASDSLVLFRSLSLDTIGNKKRREEKDFERCRSKEYGATAALYGDLVMRFQIPRD